MSVLPVLALMLAASCVAGCTGVSPTRDGRREIVLAPGGSTRLPETGRTLTFEKVVADSRCPTGVTCVWAGDAVVAIRIDGRGAASARHQLQLNLDSAREATDGDVRLRLLSVSPHPTAEHAPRPDEYRITLLIEKL